MKQKTKKAAAKRFKITSKGKVRHLKAGQAHFNARATGNQTRRKHVEGKVDSTDAGRISRLLPYSQNTKG